MPAVLRCSGHWLLTGEGSLTGSAADQSIEAVFAQGAVAALVEAGKALERIAMEWRERTPGSLRDAAALAAAADRHLGPPSKAARRARREA